jgi:molecular chaperone DnaK
MARQMRVTIRNANDVSRALADFVPSAAADVRAMQLAERDRLSAALADKVNRAIEEARGVETTDPHEARRKLDVANAELERIEAALARVPSLGLVSERGGGTT